jgi:hypothetical protein
MQSLAFIIVYYILVGIASLIGLLVVRLSKAFVLF